MHRLQLDNAIFEGANCSYLLPGDPTVLVDTGIATPPVRETFEAGLAEHGYAVADIDRILLTHHHPDHSGMAGDLAAESGATVHVHARDAPLVAGDSEAWADYLERERRAFEAWGIPADRRSELESFTGEPTVLMGQAPTVEPFEDGATFAAGETTLTAVHAPGHAAGLCCFELAGGDEILTGDALLPEYTPNVGGADLRVERPLASYLDTLERLAAADYDRAWPGHRDPIDDPTGRAREIHHHHEERALHVLEFLADSGPADAWTVSAGLFGDLEGVHILHGPGEAYAHLDHLTRSGAIERADDRYRLTEATRDRLAAHDADTWSLTSESPDSDAQDRH